MSAIGLFDDNVKWCQSYLSNSKFHVSLENSFSKISSITHDTYCRTIEIKPVNVTLSIYIDFDVENNDKDIKFKVGEHIRTLKYRNIFAKVYTPNWNEEVFVIKEVKNTFPWI